eukprot:439917_1
MKMSYNGGNTNNNRILLNNVPPPIIIHKEPFNTNNSNNKNNTHNTSIMAAFNDNSFLNQKDNKIQETEEDNIVYNTVCIESILSQIKEAMDNDPDSDRVKHENYMFLIREYFRCEISKYSLDWFMHTYYKRYIKLHNAMFKYIRWNAILKSTNANKLQSSNIKVNNIKNYPKLYCQQSNERIFFFDTHQPPNKKRKLNMPKTLQINNNGFDETMNKLQPIFQKEINQTDTKEKDIIMPIIYPDYNNSRKKAQIQINNNNNINNLNNMNNMNPNQ